MIICYRPQKTGHFAKDIEKFFKESPKKHNVKKSQLPVVCSDLAILHKSEDALFPTTIIAALNDAAVYHPETF